MSYQRTCAFEECSKHFTTLFIKQRCCSRSCGAKHRAKTTEEALKAYFLKNIVSTTRKECWPWQGSLNDQGYGMAFVRRTKVRAHRLAYELFVGPLDKDQDILHSIHCTTRSCVNWHHLHIGTHQENMHDKIVSGSQPRGSKHYLSRLTEIQVREILYDFHIHGISLSRLADRYGISIVTVHDIIYRKTWTHVVPDKYPPPTQDGRSTVNAAIVQDIRRLHTKESVPYTELAMRYGLTPDHVRKICLRLAWKQIP